MQKVPKTTIKGKAINELQGIQMRIATGAAAGTAFAVAGITTKDKILACANLTDLTDMQVSATKSFRGGAAVAEALTAITVGVKTTLAITGKAGVQPGDYVTLANFAGADAALLNGKTVLVENYTAGATNDTFQVAINTLGKTITIGTATATTIPLATGYDGVIEATTAGEAGNGLSVEFLGDSEAGVTISRVGKAFTIHYQSGTSTVGNVNTAITALAGADDLIAVKSAGTAGTVLTAPASNSTAKFLLGGLDAYQEDPVIISDGNVMLPTISTAAKKVQILYLPAL